MTGLVDASIIFLFCKSVKITVMREIAAKKTERIQSQILTLVEMSIHISCASLPCCNL